jgi:Fic family protein
MAINDAARSDREWTQIIRGEFLEIPGLRLTSDQIQKLWGLHRDTCAAVLEELLHQRFLQLTADGHYVCAASAGSRHAAPSGSYQGETAVGAR